MQEAWSLGQEAPLEKGMALCYSILAWRIPQLEEPGGLQSKRSQRIGHDWATTTLLSRCWQVINTRVLLPVPLIQTQYHGPSSPPPFRICVSLLPQWVPWSPARWTHLLTWSLLQYSQINLKNRRGFPGGPAVKNLPPNAGNCGFDPRSGNKDTTCCAATKPVSYNYWPCMPQLRRNTAK